MANAHIQLSSIACDPEVAAFLERGERDSGSAYAVPASPEPVLIGGDAVDPKIAA